MVEGDIGWHLEDISSIDEVVQCDMAGGYNWSLRVGLGPVDGRQPLERVGEWVASLNLDLGCGGP